HVMLRPDSYVGSLDSLKEKMWVIDSETERLVSREITYVPALYKASRFDDDIIVLIKKRVYGWEC
ncbi:2008_t:CDS:2, partial [Funneliformis geosporum]